MNNQEAIKAIKDNWPPENYSMLREALEIIIKLFKKQEPKSPVVGSDEEEGTEWNECGNCGAIIELYCAYCSSCGQAIKWRK